MNVDPFDSNPSDPLALQRALRHDLWVNKMTKKAFAAAMQVSATAVHKWLEIPEKRLLRAAAILGPNSQAVKLSRDARLARLNMYGTKAAPASADADAATAPTSAHPSEAAVADMRPEQLHAFRAVALGHGTMRRMVDYLSPHLIGIVKITNHDEEVLLMVREALVDIVVARQLLGDPDRPGAVMVLTSANAAAVPSKLAVDASMLGIRVVLAKQESELAEFMLAHEKSARTHETC